MSTEIFTAQKSEEETWMSISDLMAGLMIVFLFIAIAYIKGIGQEQSNLTSSICQDLKQSFQGTTWREKISVCENGLVVRFNDPDTLFPFNKANLKPEFKKILAEFFPDYLRVLNKYQEDIEEVRIEGHTDKSWKNTDPFTAYFGNMELSQNRTRSVLEFLFALEVARKHETWLTRYMTANGLSSSRPVFDKETKKINPDASRRVEFKIRLKAPKRLRKLRENKDIIYSVGDALVKNYEN